MTPYDTAARHIATASKHLQSRREAIQHRDPQGAFQLLSSACAALKKARDLLDPGAGIETIEDLCSLFAKLLPKSGKTLALHLVGWEMGLWPGQDKPPKEDAA